MDEAPHRGGRVRRAREVGQGTLEEPPRHLGLGPQLVLLHHGREIALGLRPHHAPRRRQRLKASGGAGDQRRVRSSVRRLLRLLASCLRAQASRAVAAAAPAKRRRSTRPTSGRRSPRVSRWSHDDSSSRRPSSEANPDELGAGGFLLMLVHFAASRARCHGRRRGLAPWPPGLSRGQEGGKARLRWPTSVLESAEMRPRFGATDSARATSDAQTTTSPRRPLRWPSLVGFTAFFTAAVGAGVLVGRCSATAPESPARTTVVRPSPSVIVAVRQLARLEGAV